MNKQTKPTSSPGRTDKFPPPLMRFLRTNNGSKSRRSRSKSRAKPMFFRKKNTVIETTQDPSSPKVTCIGQVRVKRSKKTKTTVCRRDNRRDHRRDRHCRCLKNLKPRSFSTVLSKWVSFFRCGCCKNSKDLHVSVPVINRHAAGDTEIEDQEQKEATVATDDDNINQGLISTSRSSPNALLTRCRSAPYRSCSLASIFMEEVAEKIESLKIDEEDEEEEKGIGVENGGVKGNEEGEGTCNGSEGDEELKTVPLILTRCKSEPARRWDQLLV